MTINRLENLEIDRPTGVKKARTENERLTEVANKPSIQQTSRRFVTSKSVSVEGENHPPKCLNDKERNEKRSLERNERVATGMVRAQTSTGNGSVPQVVSLVLHSRGENAKTVGGEVGCFPPTKKTVQQVRVAPEVESPFHLDVSIEGNLLVRALIDSGATANFINEGLVGRLGLKSYPLRIAAQTKLASKEVTVPITHAVTATIESNGVKFTKGFFVYPDLADAVVLGTPFIRAYNHILDFAKEEFNGLPLCRRVWQDLGKHMVPQITRIEHTNLEREIQQADTAVFTLLVKAIEFEENAQAGRVDPQLFNLEEFSDVVKSALPPGLPPSRRIQHTIDVIEGSSPPHKPHYRLSHADKQELTLQIGQLLKDGLIVPCGSPYGAPVIFVRKKDGSKRLCVDYRALNDISIRKRFPLPLMEDIFDTIAGAKVFSSLDLLSGYHQVRVKLLDIYKTAFVTPFGQYAWRVMPFGLHSAPATFQQLMNEIFSDVLGKSVVVYLDDILVFSKTVEEHKIHLRQALEILRQHQLVAKTSKCFFFQHTLRFLGHVITPSGIAPDPDKIKAIQNWAEIKSIKQAQSFLGLAGFYRRFIHEFSKYTACMHDYIAKKVEWGEEQQRNFELLKEKLVSPPILILPSPEFTFVVYADASNEYMGAVLHQVDKNNILLGVVAYESKKFKDAELRYPVREKEFLAIINALRKWRHFLLDKRFILFTDHESLEKLRNQPFPIGRMLRWMDFYEMFDIDVRHIKGEKNVVADCLSRKDMDLYDATECVTGIRKPTELQLSRSHYIRTDFVLSDKSKQQLIADYRRDAKLSVPYKIRAENLKVPAELKSKMEKYFIQDDLLYYAITTRDKPRLCVPAGPSRAMVFQQAHDSLAAAHRGAGKTYELLARDYYWPGQYKSCQRYVQGCAICQTSKSSTQSPQGLLLPLPVPREPWQDITLDFVSGIPKSKDGYDRILVVVDRLTKMAHFIPTVKKLDSDEAARLLSDFVFRYHGFPISMVSDQDLLFTKVFQELLRQWNIKAYFATKEHPETDGQSERVIRVVQELLRSVVSNTRNSHSDWTTKLAMCEFAYNNSAHSSTGVSPFYALYGRHPRLPAIFPGVTVNTFDNMTDVTSVARLLQDQRSAILRVRDGLAEMQDAMAVQVNRHRRDVVFDVGERVLVRRDKAYPPKRDTPLKFHFLWIGPYRIVRRINDNAYVVGLPKTRASRAALGERPNEQTFDIKSLKKWNPKSNDYEEIPPDTPEEIIKQESQIEEIQEVKGNTVVLRWFNSTFKVELTNEEYDRLGYMCRHRLEGLYDAKHPTAPFNTVFNVSPGEHPIGVSARLRSVRGRTQV